MEQGTENIREIKEIREIREKKRRKRSFNHYCSLRDDGGEEITIKGLMFHVPCSMFHVPCSMFHVP
ncbi:hypothetical protein D4R86_02715, partial [bacterium]